MKRSEFLNVYADAAAEGRKQNFPDMRPSEAAMSRVSDRETALKLWNKNRATYKDKTVEEFKAALATKP